MNGTTSNETIFNGRLNPPRNGESMSLKVAKFMLYTLVFLVGFTGNSIIVWIMIRRKKVRTFHNVLLCNLTIADLAFLCINLPFRLAYQENNYEWTFGYFLCKSVPSLTYIFLTASSLTLVVISWERYKTMSTLLVENKKAGLCGKSIIVIIWLVACALTAPFIISLEVVKKTGGKLVCTDVWSSRTTEQGYFVFLAVVQFVLPAMVMLVMYCKIATILQEARATSRRMGRNKLSSRYRKSLRLIFVIVAVYIILTLPYHVIMLLSSFGVKLNSLLKKFGVLALTATAASHPMIYSTCHQEFARGFKEIFRCSKKLRRNVTKMSFRRRSTIRRYSQSGTESSQSRRETLIQHSCHSSQSNTQKITVV